MSQDAQRAAEFERWVTSAAPDAPPDPELARALTVARGLRAVRYQAIANIDPEFRAGLRASLLEEAAGLAPPAPLSTGELAAVRAGPSRAERGQHGIRRGWLLSSFAALLGVVILVGWMIGRTLAGGSGGGDLPTTTPTTIAGTVPESSLPGLFTTSSFETPSTTAAATTTTTLAQTTTTQRPTTTTATTRQQTVTTRQQTTTTTRRQTTTSTTNQTTTTECQISPFC